MLLLGNQLSNVSVLVKDNFFTFCFFYTTQTVDRNN